MTSMGRCVQAEALMLPNEHFGPKKIGALKPTTNDAWASVTKLPASSPSCGVEVVLYVFDKNQPSLPTPLVCSCVCVSLYGPFNCISFYEFFRQLSIFSLCCSGLLSALLVLSTLYERPPEGRPGMSDVSLLSGISGLSFDSTLLSPLLFFCLVLLPILSGLFLPAGPFF